MSSKRFLIVPDDSSAASRPLPGVTMALATLLSSARFMVACSEQREILAGRTKNVKLNGSQAITNETQEWHEVNVGPPLPARKQLPPGDLRIQLALDVTLRHLGGGQHFFD